MHGNEGILLHLYIGITYPSSIRVTRSTSTNMHVNCNPHGYNLKDSCLIIVEMERCLLSSACTALPYLNFSMKEQGCGCEGIVYLHTFFSHKPALHIKETFFSLPKVLCAIPRDVCDVACGVPLLVTTLKTVVVAPFNGFVIKGAWQQNLHGILDVGKNWRPSQLVEVNMWRTFMHSVVAMLSI